MTGGKGRARLSQNPCDTNALWGPSMPSRTPATCHFHSPEPAQMLRVWRYEALSNDTGSAFSALLCGLGGRENRSRRSAALRVSERRRLAGVADARAAGGFKIVTARPLTGNVTLRGEDTTPRQLFVVIAAAQDLVVTAREGVLFVRPEGAAPTPALGGAPWRL